MGIHLKAKQQKFLQKSFKHTAVFEWMTYMHSRTSSTKVTFDFLKSFIFVFLNWSEQKGNVWKKNLLSYFHFFRLVESLLFSNPNKESTLCNFFFVFLIIKDFGKKKNVSFIKQKLVNYFSKLLISSIYDIWYSDFPSIP